MFCSLENWPASKELVDAFHDSGLYFWAFWPEFLEKNMWIHMDQGIYQN